MIRIERRLYSFMVPQGLKSQICTRGVPAESLLFVTPYYLQTAFRAGRPVSTRPIGGEKPDEWTSVYPASDVDVGSGGIVSPLAATPVRCFTGPGGFMLRNSARAAGDDVL
ncbi:MAG: hypothetical protein ABEN55_05065 [Bradymonadaceae bacterium]